MRVLVVDQDSASNEAIARSLRDLYTVDAVTNKGDCLDLLRSNTFEVVVAGERLEDGSGLELLGQISKKWPSVLRIFAADRHRLQLLRGRLGPFELFQTLTYPIDPERLIATLSLADAAQHANADTSNIQHVVLSGEPPQEVSEQTHERAEAAESKDFPGPQPAARIAPLEQARAASGRARSAARRGLAQRARPAASGQQPGHRPRRNGAAGPPTTRTASISSAAREIAPVPPVSSESGRPPGQGRPRGPTNKAPPVRIPPLERLSPLEPPQASSANRPNASQTDAFAEAAAMARAARSNFESPAEEFDARRLAVMVGGGAAVVLAVMLLAFKLFGSKSEPPRPAAPPVVQAPQYPQEVIDLIAETEAALKADDFKAAHADIDRLRQIAPSHPRLSFFEGLLAQRADSAKPGNSNSPAGRTTAKRNGQSPRRSGNAASDNKTTAVAGTAGSISNTGSASRPPGSSQSEPTLAPETPPGLSRATGASAEPAHADTPIPPPEAPTPPSADAAPAVAASASAPTPPSTAAPEPTAPPVEVQASTPPATRRASPGEPPPVIQEAKLIRRVIPDYPSAAKRDGIEGSVDLEVTVSARGVVEDVSVAHATPPDMFEKSALAAVRKWKYDPRFVDGLPSVAHLKVHLDFGPNK
jgi:protein TonB